MPASQGRFDWTKLEAKVPLSIMMMTLQDAWCYIGYVDQCLVVVFVPLVMWLWAKGQWL